MILAEKYQYLEDMEPLVEQPPVKKEHPHAVPKAKPNIGSRIVSIGMVAICFASASFTVARYAQISENHNHILTLRKSLEQEYSIQDRLKVDLAFRDNLSYIEFTAMADLGMYYPENDQVHYVSLPSNRSRSDESVIVEQPQRNIWSRLLGMSR